MILGFIIFLHGHVVCYSYCECFAAGLYCIEPCSCHDCFNNPAHEDTVLETRRQIESRNPLAFAPKVIRSTDSVSDFGVRNSSELEFFLFGLPWHNESHPVLSFC